MTHSIVAPSASARRVQCPASTKAEAQFPEGDRTDAMIGEAAHWVLAQMLAGNGPNTGALAPNGIPVDDDMLDGAEIMLDDIARELAPYGLTPAAGAIEQMIRIPRVHAESFGTPDFRIWIVAPGHAPRLMLYDYKYGHRYVPVVGNWQCVEYTAGLLDERRDLPDQTVRVTVKIVQPRNYDRAGPVRAWSFTASDIRAQVNIASNAAHEALGLNPRFATGPECRDCRARAHCPTFQRSGYNAVDESSRLQPVNLTPEALATERRIVAAALDRLKARLSGLDELAIGMLRQGQRVPGLALEFGQGREQWTQPADKVLGIARMLGVNIARPPEPLTPKQAAKAGFPLDQFPNLVARPRTGAQLTEDTGERATMVFGRPEVR